MIADIAAERDGQRSDEGHSSVFDDLFHQSQDVSVRSGQTDLSAGITVKGQTEKKDTGIADEVGISCPDDPHTTSDDKQIIQRELTEGVDPGRDHRTLRFSCDDIERIEDEVHHQQRDVELRYRHIGLRIRK